MVDSFLVILLQLSLKKKSHKQMGILEVYEELTRTLEQTRRLKKKLLLFWWLWSFWWSPIPCLTGCSRGQLRLWSKDAVTGTDQNIIQSSRLQPTTKCWAVWNPEMKLLFAKLKMVKEYEDMKKKRFFTVDRILNWKHENNVWLF